MTVFSPFGVDVTLFMALNGDAGAFVDQLMWYASSKIVWVPMYLSIVGWVWYKRGWKMALLLALSIGAVVGLADQTASIFKNYMPKLRPTHFGGLEGTVHTVRGYVGGLYGTVSAHAATTAGMGILFSSAVRKKWFTVVMILWVALVSYSRIYLGVHYPFDVLFGWLTGLLWGTIVCVIMNKVSKKTWFKNR